MRPTIVFDFDGVIHKGYDGWRDGSIYGEIDEGLLNYMSYLSQIYNIVISSCRPATQIVMFLDAYCRKNDIDLEFEIMDDRNMFWSKYGVVGVTNMKPAGALYVDDRGFRYDNLKDFIKFMEGFGR